ncbi:MAG: iron ABC transporter permease [Candidatus Bathyarchaeota archaeon]|nr:MAG: iron ABC transporter permease [Candidatus Bathyarchaeota archaeon]
MRGLTASKTVGLLAILGVLIGLFVFVLMPTFYLISFTLTQWNEVYIDVFANPLIGDTNWQQILGYLGFSLRLAVAAVIIDFLFGIPLAYFLAYRRFPGKSFLEDIIMLSLVIPTSGFGVATLLTWTGLSGIGGLIGRSVVEVTYVVPLMNVPFLYLLVHVALTFPYVVRTLQGKLEDLSPAFGQASRTLGASAFTTFRKIIFPLAIPALFSGGVLAFARSLGETGATMVLGGVMPTAPIAIVRWVSEFKLATASFLGFLLIITATIAILLVDLLLQKRSVFRMPRWKFVSKVGKCVLKVEKKLSGRPKWFKDVASLGTLFIIVILPIIVVLFSVGVYWSADPDTGRVQGGVIYQLFGPSNYFNTLMRATLTSVYVAVISTYIAACIAVPSVYMIKRYRAGGLLRYILRVPLIVPSSALGLSVLLLWGPSGLNLTTPGIWLIILTHIVFSVPVVMEPTIAAYEGAGIPSYEGVARTLGATPYDAVETVSLPMLKRGILAGVILSFTRSLGETGATFVVMGSDVTVPPLVVNMVEALAFPAALFASAYLIALSLVLLILFRFLVRK